MVADAGVAGALTAPRSVVAALGDGGSAAVGAGPSTGAASRLAPTGAEPTACAGATARPSGDGGGPARVVKNAIRPAMSTLAPMIATANERPGRAGIETVGAAMAASGDAVVRAGSAGSTTPRSNPRIAPDRAFEANDASAGEPTFVRTPLDCHDPLDEPCTSGSKLGSSTDCGAPMT